ncbi:MAG: hypothetical protein Ta2D_04970 [Rickettsiales bacterium]|nr:MAG: hypothetical protein Ta2D_04970 [Rickettsiales bacterium]
MYNVIYIIFMLQPIILSGGNGTRLFPLSRKDFPKQFVQLFNDKTLLQNTIDRFNSQKFKSPIILGNIKHKKLLEQYNNKIILEPVVKNTAPAICAIVELLKEDSDQVVVFLPSDHHIVEVDKFERYMLEGEKLAKQNKLVIFGINPTEPETGYGYIEIGKTMGNAFFVNSFKEKPNIELAKEFVKSHKYLWNAGIFMVKVGLMREFFKKYQPEIFECIEKAIANTKQEQITEIADDFNDVMEESIDYAIIEHLEQEDLAVIKMDLTWSDVGSYKSLYDILDKTDTNILNSKNIVYNSKNNYVHSDKIVCLCDVDDLVIVEDKNILLVMKKEKSQDIKEMIKEIKEKYKEEL